MRFGELADEFVVKVDGEVAGGLEILRTNGFSRRAQWILGDLVLFF